MTTATRTPQKCTKQLFVEGKASSYLQQKILVCSKQKHNTSSLSPVFSKKSTNSNTASTCKKTSYNKFLKVPLKKYPAEKSKLSPKSRDSSVSPVQTNLVNRDCHSPTASHSSHSPAMKKAKSSSSESLPTASSSSSSRLPVHKISNTPLKENECVHSVRNSLGFVKSPMYTSMSSALKPAGSSSSATLTNGISDWIDLLDESSEIVASSDQWDWDSPIVVDDDSTDNYVRFAQLEEDEAFARHLQAQFDLEAQSHEHRSPFHATRENSFPEFCGLPGCGEYDLLVTSDIGYCGKPGCRESQHRNGMLASEVIDPVLHDLQRFFDDATGRSRRTRRHSRHQTTSIYLNDANDGNDYEDLLAFEESQGSAVAQKKLSSTEINRLPITFFDPKHAAEKTQCHICFNDYSLGEKLRILPCLHDYHSQCIDRWLKGHLSCPICRVDVKLESA
ncbi:uncharacterized protein si:ch211-59o9.10 isoform X2 [Pristis pectinata]|nr:uncharacterized protein si:ch211-59o9.10 isoform X2 [Pristis pectinata]